MLSKTQSTAMALQRGQTPLSASLQIKPAHELAKVRSVISLSLSVCVCVCVLTVYLV